MSTNTALLSSLLETRVQIILLAVHLAMDIVKRLAPQRTTAGAADEAPGVVQIAHGLTRLRSTCHPLPTCKALTEVFPLGGLLHVIF